ncbi:MAG: TonB-dependent receptor [Bacteroidales bacterium]|nr:TonB-dependent receptor [Bacteroidales bacterium]
MLFRGFRYFFVFASLWSAPVLSYALCETDSIVERTVQEVSVVTDRQREVVAPQRLGGKQLQQLSAHSVADAVRYFSGVQMKDYGGVGGMKTVDVRSMGSNHLGVFFDGLPVGNAQNGIVDLGRFSLDNMEEVTIYNGQKSEIFQPARDFGVSASLYLKTRRPHFASGKRSNVTATVRGGSFGLINPSLTFEKKIGSSTSFVANAEYTHAHGRYEFSYHKVGVNANGNAVTAWDTVGTRQNGDVKALRIEGALLGTTSDGEWQIKGYYYDSERGIPRAIVRNVWTSSQRQWDTDIFVQGGVRHSFSAFLDHKVNAKYAYSHMRYLNPDTTLLYVDNSFTQQSFYVSSANVAHLADNHLDFDVSVDYERNWMSSDMVNFAYPVRNTLLAAIAVAFNSRNMKMQASMLGNFIKDDSTQGREDLHQWTKRLTPYVIANYDVNRSFSLHAFYKKMFRMPTFNDLYYTDIGNIRLRPEYASQFDLGARLRIAGPLSFEVNADVYHNRITDKILAVPKGNSQYRWMMMNIGKVHINGIDISGNVASKNAEDADAFSYGLRIAYTYQRAMDMSDPSDNGPRGTYKGQISYIPCHSGSVIVNAGFHGWSACYSFIYVGERYHVSANIAENYEPSWYTHDMTVAKHFELHKVKLDITGELNNIFDQRYDVVLNYPMPGRNWKAILRIGW